MTIKINFEEKAVNGELAKQSSKVYTNTEDLQKALPHPKQTVSETYYRRNVYCCNLGVHDVGNNIGYMYVRDETTASKRSQKISSCSKAH